MIGINNISVEFLSDTIWLNIVAGLILLTLAIFLYLRTNPPIPKYLKAIFISLRVIAILALLCALFEPILSYEQSFSRKPRVAVLLDESKSIEKVEDDLTRRVRRDSLLSSSAFEFVNEQADVSSYYFGENVSADVSEIKSDATSLADAVLYVGSHQIESEFDFQILFSDGNSNTGRQVGEITSLLKTKTHTVDLSLGGKQYDLSVVDVDYNPVLFSERTTEIKLKIKWENSEPQTIPIQLLDSTRVVAQSTFSINQSEGFGEIVLKYRPTESGQKILSLKVATSEVEENKSNNTKSFSVKVLKSKLEVLLLSENPDYELSFLKKQLQKADKYNIELRLLGRKSGNLTGAIPSRQAELNKYDLIIIHDVSPSRLASKQALFDSYLQDKGGSIWFLLGENYASSEISPWMNSLLPFSQTGKSHIRYTSFHAEPSEGNLYHPSIRIAENQTAIRKGWAELPPFEQIVRCESVLPQATILAFASGLKKRDGSQMPIIGFVRKGAGKVLAVAAQPFWNFGFLSVGFGESDEAYKSFIEGSVDWLTVSDDLEPIRIFPQKSVFTRGEAVSFDGFAFDLGYRPIENVTGTVELKGSGDNLYQADLLLIDDGKYKALLQNVTPDRYTYKAAFTKDGRILKDVTGQIEVGEFSLEEFDRDGDSQNLKLIASLSGGTYTTASDFGKFVQAIDWQPIKVIKKTEVNLWDKLLLLILFISALSLEWLIRKLNQLI